jgi:hypothetical protein
MGMRECQVPQSSAHWPRKVPSRLRSTQVSVT